MFVSVDTEVPSIWAALRTGVYSHAISSAVPGPAENPSCPQNGTNPVLGIFNLNAGIPFPFTDLPETGAVRLVVNS